MYKSTFNYKDINIKHSTKFNSYFQKLQVTPNKLTLKLVKELQQKHLETFSFNNLAVLLNKPISLKIDDIIEKIVLNNLGGYCFEHNKLFYEVLKSLGFQVEILIARVLNNQKIESPRTHRITLLTFKEKKYLLDVGFGIMTPNIPIEITSKNNLVNGYKISCDKNNDFTLLVNKKESFIGLYRFNLVNYNEADCKMANYYSQSHPDAVFQNNLVISKKSKDGTLSFRNNSYHQISNTYTNIFNIINNKQLRQVFQKDFGIIISKDESRLLFEKAERFRLR